MTYTIKEEITQVLSKVKYIWILAHKTTRRDLTGLNINEIYLYFITIKYPPKYDKKKAIHQIQLHKTLISYLCTDVHKIRVHFQEILRIQNHSLNSSDILILIAHTICTVHYMICPTM